MRSIYDMVREAEKIDRTGQTTSSRYVQVSLRDDVDKTEAYLNSKHTTGETDYLGREKPFFNIVMALRNIWFRATDLDVKDIKIRATKSVDEIKAFLATILLQQWMKKSKFGQFLNDLGLALATHGSSVAKFVEKEGELVCAVQDWNNLIVDPIDFENNIKIEKLYFTPAQLQRQKGYNKEIVDRLLDNLVARETANGTKKDFKNNYILIYEVHGELPLSFLTDKESDEDTYVQQVHIINFLYSKEKDSFDDFTLYSGREEKDPYFITHLIKKDGITYSGGAVKNAFEAQWMVNHSQKQIKDQLDLASKIIFQTSDGSFAGTNALNNIENGDILSHKLNEPLTMLNNKPDIAAMQAAKNDWQFIANQINGVSEAMAGENAPSGTAWRLVQAQLQESHSLFELMTENKGLAIVEILRKYVIPYFKKQLNNSNEISGILEEWQIKQIDARYIPNEVTRRMNQKKKQTILSGKIYDPGMEGMDRATAEQEIKSGLTGQQRFIKPSDIDKVTWKEVLKDLEWDLDIDITNENKDTQGMLATLTSVLQSLATNPGLLQDPNMKLIFSKILSISGSVSPLELSSMPAPAPQQALQPQGQPVQVGGQMSPQPQAQPA